MGGTVRAPVEFSEPPGIDNTVDWVRCQPEGHWIPGRLRVAACAVNRLRHQLWPPRYSGILSGMLGLLPVFLLVLLSACSSPPSYDLAIVNGRVMDPESGLDAARNVGIQGGKIAVTT